MKKLILSLFINGIFFTLFAQQQIAVMDATYTPELNGVYKENGTYNGMPRYTKDNLGIYYKGCNTKWAIQDTNNLGSCPLYSSGEDLGGTLPPTAAWHRGGYWGMREEQIMVGKPSSIIISHDYFVESLANDGSISNDIPVVIRYFYRQGGTFTGSNGDNFVTGNKVNVYNLPAGLAAVVTRTSDTTLALTITGNATNHTPTDDSLNVELEFLDGAFSHGDTALVEDYLITHIRIFFNREQVVVSGAENFPQINGTYIADGFYNGATMYRKGNYWLGNRGCNSTWVIILGRGNMPWGCPFAHSVVESVRVPETWYEYGRGNTSYPVTVAIPNSLSYSKDIFSENLINDGSINNSDTGLISLTDPFGFTFSGSNGDNFVSLGRVNVYNMPTGLTAQINKINDTTLTFIITGNAVSHAAANSVYNLTLEFLNSAFTNNDTSVVSNSTKDDIQVIFNPEYYFVGNASSHPGTNGIYLCTGTHNGLRMYKKNNYFLGYRNCYTKWVINNGGESSIDNTCPIYSTMQDDTIPGSYGWKNGGRNYNSEDIIVAPINSIYYYNKSFVESELNNGSFNDTILVQYIYPIFGVLSGSNGENFVTTGKVTVTNLPTGLTLAMYRTSDTTLNAVLTGTTLNSRNDLLDLSISFQNTAFTHNDASFVKFASRNDLCILSHERILVKDAITTSEVNGIYRKTGYINGRPSYSKGIYRLGFRGCTSQWVITNYNNDYSSMRGVCPPYRTTLFSEYPYDNDRWEQRSNPNEKIEVHAINALTYSINGFKECRLYHDGRISKEDTLIIRYCYPDNNATFTGTNGEDFIALGKVIVQNLPEGLSMHLIRINDTTIISDITGKAVDHNTDVSDLTILFQNSAFSHNDTSTVINSSKKDLTINFISVYTVASSGADFNNVNSAVNSSLVTDGDILMLADETFTVANLTISKDLAFIGQGPGRTILQPSATPGTGNSRIFYLNWVTVEIENMTFRNANYSGSYGGAIYNYYSDLTLKNCEFYDNRNAYTNARGGAISSRYSNLYIENCTFNNNRAEGTNIAGTYGGGAINIYHSGSEYQAHIVNSTFYGNYSYNNGGGILCYGNVDIINTTIVGDTAVNYGGGYHREGYTTNALNTIFANNVCTTGPDYYSDLYGDNNLISNSANANILGSNNLLNVNPEIQPLADNGGPTRTCAIPTTSPAINAGSDAGAPLCDQRGANRPDTTDIGAYEYNGVVPTIITASSFGGPYIVSRNSSLALDVPYTISGTFNASNLFYAFISGPDTCWAGEKAIGELNSTNAGTIASIIDTMGLKPGVSQYKVRVKSTDPSIIGSESNVITITYLEQYIYPTDSQIVNITEDGDTLRVFESMPPDSRAWMYGTSPGSHPTSTGWYTSYCIPNFAAAGTYYMVCVSVYGAAQVVSNEVVIRVVQPEIIIDSISNPPFHVTDVISESGTVYYTAIGRYSGNIFSAYLSDKNGSFATETLIGSVGSNISGTIGININAGIETGTGYKIRVKSISPAVTSAASDSFMIEYDTLAPTPVLSSSSGNYVNDTIEMDIDFGEYVTGFSINDLTLDNCTASGLSTDDNILYSIKLIAENEGVFTAQVDSGAAYDKVGLASLTSEIFTRTFDNTRPSVQILSDESDTTVLWPFTVEIRFNEIVSGFELGDVNVSNGTAVNFTETQNDRRWTVDIRAVNKGNINIDVNSGVATDRAGNSNTSATRFRIYYDGDVGVKEVIKEIPVQVYPNPTDGLIFVKNNGNYSIHFTLTDITGKILSSKQMYSALNEIDMVHYAKGIYFVQLSYGETVENIKIILK
ncbi:MAG: T9SS type A sorting domain-containing protein [Bacteroidales bacterium]|nr:T9SS type A sorting domain-containing protein [Bacteroidales bacterium]